jgi:hypothetical protein
MRDLLQDYTRECPDRMRGEVFGTSTTIGIKAHFIAQAETS